MTKIALLRLALLVPAAVAIGCSSPSIASSTPAPAAATAPTPSAPTFPSLSGTWNGTVSITDVLAGHNQSVTGVCNTTWTNTQFFPASTFGGTMSISSSSATNAATCGGGLNYTGTVTTAGAVSIPNLTGWALNGVTYNGVALNGNTNCSLKAVNVPMAGTVSGRTWRMTQQDSWLCVNNTVEVDRTLLVQLTQ